MTKHIFVTGGVVSSLGKGLNAASIGMLLESHGYKISLQKFDPYVNVDPGTMGPFEHGEIYVTEDGAGEIAVVHLRLAKLGQGEIHARKTFPAQFRPLKNTLLYQRTAEVHALEVGANDVGAFHVGLAQVRIG